MTKTDAQIAADLMLVHYEAEIADKKAVSFSVNVERSGSQKELDDAMDKCRLSVVRQKKFAQIDMCLTDIAVNEAEVARINFEIGRTQAQAADRVKESNPLRKGAYYGLTKEAEGQLQAQISSVNEKLGWVEKLKHRLAQLRHEVGEPPEPMKQAAE
jgi:hypothetical protein